MDGGYGTNSTTPLVKKITQDGISFEYTYDSRGDITSEKRGSLTTTYNYDLLGRMTRENNPHENATWFYYYSRGGNITKKERYAYTTGAVGAVLETITYSYGDSNWRDKLTKYNGVSITYDAIGNPLNDGTWTYTWAAGRQLQGMVSSSKSVSFQYDHNGLRTRKAVTEGNMTTVTDYILHGKLVTHMTVSKTVGGVTTQDTLHFFYDAQSRPTKVSYNGTMYTYLHNLQGDIVGILDSSGALVVEYKYDAWGRALSTVSSLTTELAEENPFRYRGYVYDEETGLYYLRSRYYNPTWYRFVNADKYIGDLSTLEESNPYVYCLNNSLTKTDSNGTHSNSAFPEMPIMHDIPKDPIANKNLVTEHAINQLLTNATIAIKKVQSITKQYSNPIDVIFESLLWFKNQVDHKAVWDYKRYKRTPEWLIAHGESTVTINGIEMEMHGYGNFNYGFVGYAMGIPREILILGSIYAHYTDNGNWDDDPCDWEMIDAGIELAKQYQANGMLSY